jgi:hypothetical protein
MDLPLPYIYGGGVDAFRINTIALHCKTGDGFVGRVALVAVGTVMVMVTVGSQLQRDQTFLFFNTIFLRSSLHITLISGIYAVKGLSSGGCGLSRLTWGGGGTGVWWVWGPRNGSNRSPLRGDHITPQGGKK